MGGRVVGRVLIDQAGWERESSDLLAAAQPESIYIIAYGERPSRSSGTFAVRATRLICAGSAFYTNQIVDAHPDFVEGVFFPQPAFDIKSESPLAREFIATYRQRHGNDPDIYARTPTMRCGS